MSIMSSCDEYLVNGGDLFKLAGLLTSDDQMIYFIQRGEDGPIKIGVSANIIDRFNSLQTAQDERLRIVGIMKGGFSQERQIHAWFKHLQVRGEWYAATPELRDYIYTSSLIKGPVGLPEQPPPDPEECVTTFPRVLQGLPPLLICSEKGTAVRAFTPAEVDALKMAIKQQHHRTLFNILLWTGMRYVEAKRLHEHPEYVLRTRGYIDLPLDVERKLEGKRTPPRRQIPIPQQISGDLDIFFQNQAPPTIQVWGKNLKRWADQAGIGSEGVSPKSTRKTIESWMIVIDMPINKVCLRQGHDSVTSMGYYQNMAFTYDEIAEIKRRLASWMV